MSRKTTSSNTLKTTDRKISIIQCGPEENSHVSNYRAAMERFPLSFVPRLWSQIESNNIGKGIKQQFQQMSFQMSVDLCGEHGDSVDLDAFLESIASFDITPDHMQIFLPKVDWDQLASTHVSGHSGAECRSRWMNWENPLINHNKWGVSEDRNLLKIVQNNGYNNWIDIASLLGTNRTPFQCLARFQRSLNPFIMRSDWSHEEDLQLTAAVETFGESNWQLVASAIDGRTGTQCSNRWYKTLHPMRKREGRWNWDEDKLLKVTVALMGAKSWNKIAEMVPGRTQAQCRERWVNCLDPSLNLNKWTEEEDSLLKVAITEHGYCWSKIARCVPPRTDNQCRRRWKHLFPQEVPLLQAARKVIKSALVSNFVDRESERSALTHRDFIPLPVITASSEPDPNLTEKRKKYPVRECTKKNKKKTKSLDGYYESEEQGSVLSGSTTQNPEPNKAKRMPRPQKEGRRLRSDPHLCKKSTNSISRVQKCTKKNKRKVESWDGYCESEQALVLYGSTTQSPEPKKTKICSQGRPKRKTRAPSRFDFTTHSDPNVNGKEKSRIKKRTGMNEKKVNTSVNDYDSEHQCLALFDPTTEIHKQEKRKTRIQKRGGMNEKKVNTSVNENDSEHQCLVLFDPTTEIHKREKRKIHARKIKKLDERKTITFGDCYDSEEQCLVSFSPATQIAQH